jgi:hypothetical protein
MLALATGFVLLLAEGGLSWSAMRELWDHYLNYPGFEIWKFVNLGIFIGLGVYAGKRLRVPDWFKEKA